MKASGKRWRWSRAAECYAAGLFLLYAGLLLGHATPPSLTDYANWTYQGVLLKNHLLGRPDLVHWLKPYPVPNSAATVGVALLALFLPWELAAKLWLCLQLGLSFAVLRHLLRTLEGRDWAWLLVPQAVFLNVNFWYGFMNFQLGLCWVLLAASLLLRRARTDARESNWPVGVVLVLAFFTHMIPFAFAGLLVLLYTRQTRRARMLWQVAPGAALTLWYLAGRFLLAGNGDGQAGMVATVKTYSAAFWAYKVNSYVKSFGFVSPETQDYFLFGRGLFMILLLVNLALCLAAGWALIATARRAFAERSDERFLWLGIGLLVPAYLLAPGAALGVSDPGSRLLQAALALGLVLACRKGSWTMPVAAGGGVLLACMGVFLFVRMGFAPGHPLAAKPSLPARVVEFNHVPNDDQDYFYTALRRGDLRLQVFPTGMFLNRNAEPPPGEGGSAP